MNFRELKELILEGESSRLEFKRKIVDPQKLAKELSAFANTKGGKLLIGIDDDGTVVGVSSEKSNINFVVQVCEFDIDPPINPQIEIVNIFNRDVVVVTVEESLEKPHYILNGADEKRPSKRAYIRVGEKSVVASREMSRFLKSQNVNSKPVRLSIGDKEKRLFLYLENHEKATVNDFAKLVNISKRRAERLMIRLVRAGVLQIHFDTAHDYFTLV